MSAPSTPTGSGPPAILTKRNSSNFECSVCDARAKLIYQCGRCSTVRRYCQSYSCQSDDWDKHQQECSRDLLMAGFPLLEFMEDTVIKHVSGGPTWTRSRKVSLAPSDSFEAFTVVRPLSSLPYPSLILLLLILWLRCCEGLVALVILGEKEKRDFFEMKSSFFFFFLFGDFLFGDKSIL